MSTTWSTRANRPALSLHVYSPSLTTMTFFAIEEGRLVARGVKVTDDGVEDHAELVRGLQLVAQRLPRTADDLLAESRGLIQRVGPAEFEDLREQGALVVDIRPERQRGEEGELPFGVVVERNVLEWRFDLQGDHALTEITGYDQPVVVVCSEGYASELRRRVPAEPRLPPGGRSRGRLPGLAQVA